MWLERDDWKINSELLMAVNSHRSLHSSRVGVGSGVGGGGAGLHV